MMAVSPRSRVTASTPTLVQPAQSVYALSRGNGPAFAYRGFFQTHALCERQSLWVAFEDGTETKLTFRDLSDRSSQIANYYRELGVRRGDRVLVMLGSVPALWESVLALIKLGAVILPATPLLSRDDLADRIERGGVRHIVCAADCASKFEQMGQRDPGG